MPDVEPIERLRSFLTYAGERDATTLQRPDVEQLLAAWDALRRAVAIAEGCHGCVSQNGDDELLTALRGVGVRLDADE